MEVDVLLTYIIWDCYTYSSCPMLVWLEILFLYGGYSTKHQAILTSRSLSVLWIRFLLDRFMEKTLTILWDIPFVGNRTCALCPLAILTNTRLVMWSFQDAVEEGRIWPRHHKSRCRVSCDKFKFEWQRQKAWYGHSLAILRISNLPC